MRTRQKCTSNTHYLSEHQSVVKNKTDVLYDPAQLAVRQVGKHAHLAIVIISGFKVKNYNNSHVYNS